MPVDEGGLQILDEDACLRLLAQHSSHLGRVAFITDEGLPIVLPVNYRLHKGDVVFRSGVGTKLDAAATGTPVAFQVDQVDPIWREGWSVVVQGEVREITDADELEEVRALPLRAWAPGERDRYLRISAHRVSGREIV